MRNIVQMDHEKGFLAIGDVLRPGQTVQFHLRDTEAANEELDLLLENCSLRGDRPPRGAAIYLHRPRSAPLLSAQLRIQRIFRPRGPHSPNGLFLQRRNRPRWPLNPPTRLYQLFRSVPSCPQVERSDPVKRGDQTVAHQALPNGLRTLSGRRLDIRDSRRQSSQPVLNRISWHR